MSMGTIVLYALGYVVGGAILLCTLAWLCYSTHAWLATLMDKAVDREEARFRAALEQHVQQHRPDCACDPCWDKHCERLVEHFDWDAAEHDIAWRRP